MFWKKDKKDNLNIKSEEIPALMPDEMPRFGNEFGVSQPGINPVAEEDIKIPTPEEFGLEMQGSEPKPKKTQVSYDFPKANPEKKGILNKMFTSRKDAQGQEAALSNISPLELSQVFPNDATSNNQEIPSPESLGAMDMGGIGVNNIGVNNKDLSIDEINPPTSLKKEDNILPQSLSQEEPKQESENTVFTGVKKDSQLTEKIIKLEKTILDYRKEIEETAEKIALIAKDLRIKDLNAAVKRKVKPKKAEKTKKSKPKKQGARKKQKTTAKKRRR